MKGCTEKERSSSCFNTNLDRNFIRTPNQWDGCSGNTSRQKDHELFHNSSMQKHPGLYFLKTLNGMPPDKTILFLFHNPSQTLEKNILVYNCCEQPMGCTETERSCSCFDIHLQKKMSCFRLMHSGETCQSKIN